MDIFGPLEDKRTIWPFKNPLEEKEDKEDPVTWLYMQTAHFHVKKAAENNEFDKTVTSNQQV